MLLDLIRALPAAVVVGVLPGWFWARCLCATADRAERLAYSVAFSITLVPTAGLAQARLFGTGVTSAITIVSILLVMGSGLGAYLRFGPAKGAEEPLGTRLAPLGLPTLMPLVGAFALALGNILGVVTREWAVPAGALLVLSGGAAHLLGSRRDTPPSQPLGEPVGLSGSPTISAARWLLLSVVLALVLLRSYPGPVRHDWPFPRGVDRFEHAVMTKMMLSEGTTESFMLYPPGFHVLAAEVSRLSGGLEALQLFAVLAPALLALAALGCYALASRLWGWPYGVAAAAFSGLLLGGSYEHVSHARYANLIAAQFLLVLAVGALVRLYASSSIRDQLTLAVLGSSVVFYHQVASLYEVVLLALVVVLFLPYLLAHERTKGLALLSSFALLGFLSVLYAWDTYDLGRLVGGLVGGAETGKGGEAVTMALGTKPPLPLDHLLETTSQPALWLGLLGALLLLADPGSRANTPDALARVTLLAWVLLLVVGSRTAMSSFPDRFERDLTIPLALLAAFAFLTVVQALVASGPTTSLVALLAVVLIGTTAGVHMVRNIEEAAGPSDRDEDRAPPPEVAAAGRWLEEHNSGGNILATPYVSETSARGILAMGGYSAMQSFTEKRIRRARDLPPFGAGPLRDAQWALHHPGGERTGQILEDNDVRYIVLYKRYPGIDWRSFQDRADLYRKVYENKVAVIFAPRKT